MIDNEFESGLSIITPEHLHLLKVNEQKQITK